MVSENICLTKKGSSDISTTDLKIASNFLEDTYNCFQDQAHG